jgi:hypothetical protein
MRLSKEELFPTVIDRILFNNEEISYLLKEILEKKQKIKETSAFYNDDISENYFTDYKNPNKLYEYEKLMTLVGAHYAAKKLSFTMMKYWTACYGKNSTHRTHTHKSYDFNFSSILYLTNNGGTNFYTPNYLSNQFEYYENSEVGKLVIFPNSLLHSVMHDQSDERIIISSNLNIK